MQVIKDEVLVERLTMVSGVEQQSAIHLWDYVIEKDGTHWFWPNEHDESGAMVHMGSIYAGQRSEGYAGRTLDFTTKDGVIKIQGPWHSNSDALYEKTGVDLRNKHRTMGVISLERGSKGSETVLLKVVYMDPEEGMVGTFDRVQELAQKMSDANNCVLYYYRRSSGGSSCGPVYPSSWTEAQKWSYHYPKKD